MGYVISLLLAGLFLQVPVSGAHATGLFSLTIHSEKKTYKPGTPVDILLTVENISSSDIMWMESYPELTYVIQVVDKNGKMAPRTHYGRILKREEQPGPNDVIRYDRHGGVLPPKGKLVRKVNLNVVYELNQSGEYSVWLCKVIPRSGSREVCSNHLNIHLTDRVEPK